MQDDLNALLAARRGHFQLESGHHADMWLDLDALFVHPQRLRPIAQQLALQLAKHDIEAVCGPVVGGAYVAQMIALELDLEFFHADRLISFGDDNTPHVQYRVPNRTRGWLGGKRVAIVDDVISTGSAARATYTDLTICGARPVALGALLVLGFAAPTLAQTANMALETIAQLPSHYWTAADCPLCAAKVALESPEST
ncbi:MAG TPA: phosphoribosyltransferase family protein [Magnetospirillaceae bacterium]|jgi:orotate phosphoribosyltransferase